MDNLPFFLHRQVRRLRATTSLTVTRSTTTHACRKYTSLLTPSTKHPPLNRLSHQSTSYILLTAVFLTLHNPASKSPPNSPSHIPLQPHEPELTKKRCSPASNTFLLTRSWCSSVNVATVPAGASTTAQIHTMAFRQRSVPACSGTSYSHVIT